MRSGVLIGAAMAVLTARLIAGNGDGPAQEPPAAQAASAAAALLVGAAASAPAVARVASGHGAHAAFAASAPVSAPPAASAAEAADAARTAAGRQVMRAASVEAEVQARRTRGEGEDAVYRARATQLPAADVAQLMAMEAAEAAWQRQLNAAPADSGVAPDHVVASAYRRDAAPRLTLE